MPTAERLSARRQQLADVLELHASGLSILAIAGRLGVPAPKAAKLLSEALRALPAQGIEELRATSELRLDRIARVWSELLDDTDPKIRAQAAEGLRRCESDRARLLGTSLRPPKDEADE